MAFSPVPEAIGIVPMPPWLGDDAPLDVSIPGIDDEVAAALGDIDIE
ncbi:MAG: hypothetical protein M3N95_08475 [Actinomycetota bacterium]|nr:hypothetical protein [Actinomycetota bacterium]